MRAKESKLYDLIASKITKIREQGEPPKSDVLSLDQFVCDLCKAIVPRSKIIQCAFCGRWVCFAQCWFLQEKACLACSSVIKLCRESRRLERTAVKKETKKRPRKRRIKPELRLPKILRKRKKR